MIIGKIQNIQAYAGVHEKLLRAADFIGRAVLEGLAPGRYEIEGDALYASIQEYETHPDGELIFEGHKKYIDLQFIAKGRERIEAIDISKATETKGYDEKIEAAFFKANEAAHKFFLSEGDFAIFLPQDLHCPGRRADGVTPEAVKKIIVKLAVKS